MNKLGYTYAALLVVATSVCSMPSNGAEQNRKWMTSACYKFRLDAWDKFDGPAWNAKYVITSTHGETFIAEKNNISDGNESEVFFPDDFHDAKEIKISASVDCFHGDTYKWRTYINGKLMDSGTIGFTRDYPPK